MTTMDRRSALRMLAASAVASPAVLGRRYRLFARSVQEYSDRAVRLVTESPVVDMLCQFAFPDYRGDSPPRALEWMRDPVGRHPARLLRRRHPVDARRQLHSRADRPLELRGEKGPGRRPRPAPPLVRG